MPADDHFERAAQRLSGRAIQAFSMLDEMSRSAAFAANLEEQGRNFLRWDDESIASEGGPLILQLYSRRVAEGIEGFSKVRVGLGRMDARVESKPSDRTFDAQLRQLQQAVGGIGLRALFEMGVPLSPQMARFTGELNDITVDLVHYPAGAVLPSPEGSPWQEGHRDEVEDGVVVGMQLTPDPRTWRLGWENALSTVTQNQGDRIWLESRPWLTDNPNPYHAVKNANETPGMAVLITAPGLRAGMFNVMLQQARADLVA
jgi:hypothetical protein